MDDTKTSSDESPWAILDWQIKGNEIIFKVSKESEDLETEKLEIICSKENDDFAIAHHPLPVYTSYDNEKKSEIREENKIRAKLFEENKTNPELTGMLGAAMAGLEFLQPAVDDKICDLNEKLTVSKKNVNRNGYVALAAGALFVAAGAYAAINGDDQLKAGEKKGFLDGEKKGFIDGEKQGLSHGYLFGFENGSKNASLTQNLESRILNGEGKWNASVAYDAGKKLFNTADLHNMTFDQLVILYGKLNVDYGVYSTPAAKNLTTMLKETLNGSFKISNDSMKDIKDPVAALNLLKTISQAEVYATAAGWNATAREQLRQEILALAPSWGLQNYTAGQNGILEQVPAWGLENITAGEDTIRALAEIWNATHEKTGYDKSFAEMIAVVDDVLTQGEITDASGNTTKLIDVYTMKIKADAYEAGLQNTRMKQWMNSVTTQSLMSQNIADRNSTLATWKQNADMFPQTAKDNGWGYVHLDDKLNSTVMLNIYNDKNLTNETKNTLRDRLTAGSSVNIYNLTGNDSYTGFYNRETNTLENDGLIVYDNEYTIIKNHVNGGK